jgi:hypothetical protein
MTTRYLYPRFKAPLHIVAANDNHAPPDGSPKGPRPISKLTDEELANLEANFVAAGVEASQRHTLKQIRRELMRRATKGLDGGEVVGHILTLASTSKDYLLSYGDLHASLWPTEDFVGHSSIRKIKAALGAAILYSVENGLPCITTLVVHAKTRCLSERAARNIYETLKGLGVEVGANVEDYVLEHTLAAMDVVAKANLPEAA